MKHATRESLARLERLLVELRRRERLIERRPGVFYHRSRAFLHFHEDPAGLFADVRLGDRWSRYHVTSSAEQKALLARIDEVLGAGGG